MITSESLDMMKYLKRYNFGSSICNLTNDELLNAIQKISNMNQKDLKERILLAQKELCWNNESIKLFDAMQKYKII